MIKIFMPWPLQCDYFGEYLHFYNIFKNHKNVKLVNNFDVDYIIYINDIKNIHNHLQKYKRVKLNYDLLEKIKNYNNHKKEIILDYTDFTNTEFSCDNKIFNDIFLYFKRSIVYKKKLSLINLNNIIPLSYAIRNDFLEHSNNQFQRDYDISCLFKGNERGLRGQVANYIKNLKYKVFVGRIKYKKDVYSSINLRYLKQMQKSKIVVTCNPKYQEGDFRLWEAISSKALVFVDKMLTPINNKLIHKKHVIYYNSLNELGILLKYYLEHENERCKIANECFNFCVKNHTFKNRVDYILDSINLKNKITFTGNMLIYSICYYYGKNNKDNINAHLECFNHIDLENKIFVINCMIDSEDHTNAKKDLENYLKKFNIKYEILTSYNWGGTILGLWMVYKYFYEKVNLYNNVYIAHFEEDFRPIKPNFYIASKRRIDLFGKKYIYIGETRSGKINRGDKDGRLTAKAYKYSTRLGNPEVWMDGGYYFSNLENLKKIEDKIGIFHKGNKNIKYNRKLDGIDLGEVGFPTLVHHAGFKFYPLPRSQYFIHHK